MSICDHFISYIKFGFILIYNVYFVLSNACKGFVQSMQMEMSINNTKYIVSVKGRPFNNPLGGGGGRVGLLTSLSIK